VPKTDKYALFQLTYRDDPVGFMRDCIEWPKATGPAPYQDEILRTLPIEKRVAVRGPHGLGKTALAAIVVLWFALTRDGEDWKVLTTASAFRQLDKFLWPEIHKWARRLRWDKICRPPFNSRTELMKLSLQLSTGQAFALSSDDPNSIEGAHAESLCYVFDEAKAIPDGIWDSAEGAFASPDTAEVLALAISTPGPTSGRFYEIHTRKAGTENWWPRHVTLDESISAGRISRSWAEQCERLWGEDDARYKNRVLGEFAAQDETGVIPLAWIEAANGRWEDWRDEGFPGRMTTIGVDMGGGGEGGDKSVLAIVYDGVKVKELRSYGLANDPHTASMEIVGRIRGAVQAGALIIPDAQGVGAGAYNRLAELGHNVTPFIASFGTGLRDAADEMGFVNWRSAMWWIGREMLTPDSGFDICLPPDDDLTGDLCAPKYRVVSGGRYQIESKDAVRKRIKRSTDSADAVLQALVGPALARERAQGGETMGKLVYDPVRF